MQGKDTLVCFFCHYIAGEGAAWNKDESVSTQQGHITKVNIFVQFLVEADNTLFQIIRSY